MHELREDKLLRSLTPPHAASSNPAQYFKEATERVTTILESITDAFVALDTDWNIVYLNARAAELVSPLHPSRESLIGRNHWQAFPDAVGTIIEESYRRAMREQVTVRFEHFYPPLNRWFEIRAYPSPHGLSVYFQDITERRRGDDVLRQSEDRWRGIFTHAAVGAAMAGLDHRFIEVNSRFAEIVGYTPEEMLTLTPEEITHPDDRPHTAEFMRRLHAGEIPSYAMEKRYCRKDGSCVWVYSTVTAVRDESGQPKHFIGIIEDITQRKKSEQEIRLGRERLELALAAGGLGDWDWDAASDVVSLSPRAAEIFGLAARQITWTRMRDLLHEDDRERARLAVERALETRSHYNLEYRVLKNSKDLVWIAARGRGRYDSEGSIIGMSGVVADVTDRKHADETRFRLAAVVESSDDAIISMDLHATIATWNKGAERTFGYTAEEIVGKPIMMLIPAGREHEEPALIQRLLRGERIQHFETVRMRKDGTLVDVSLSFSPVVDANGQIVGVSKISRDITARKQTEEMLRRSEEELRALANSIPQLAWMAQPDGHIFWYNQKWYEYTGTTLEQMQGWGWQSVHDPNILPRVVERWQQSLSTGEPFDMEFPLRGADGQFRWFLTRVNPVRDREGRITRWFGTNTDVDVVRRTQDALREETRILELLNETGTAIGAQLELQKVVQIVTDAATKLCGAKFGAFFYNVIDQNGEAFLLYTLSGAPREAFERFGHPRATPLFGPTFRGEGIIRSDDILKDPRYGQLPPHHGMPKGHLPVRSYLAVPVLSRGGEVIGGLFFGHPETGVFTERSERLIVGVAAQAAIAIDNARLFESAQREITERKRVAEELRKAQEELSHHAGDLERQVAARTASLREAVAQLEEFSYSVSHDLRAPIRAIAGYTRIFRDDFGKSVPPEGQVFLDKISRATQRMERLVNDVLTISRVARADITLHPIPLQPFVQEILEQHPQMQEPHASVSVIAPHTVIGDDASLGQALSNLLNNAVKFVSTGQKPVVTVRSEQRADRVRIWVEDQGIGIAPQHRSKLFGMFQRLPADLQYEGSGIGLAIVRKAAERMGGSVGMEANEPQGSRFWVELKRTE